MKRNGASKKDKAMIWAAATGHFDTDIIKGKAFQKNVSLALKARISNPDFGINFIFCFIF